MISGCPVISCEDCYCGGMSQSWRKVSLGPQAISPGLVCSRAAHKARWTGVGPHRLTGRKKQGGGAKSRPQWLTRCRWVGTTIPKLLCQPVPNTQLQSPKRPLARLPHLPVSYLSRHGPELCSKGLGSKPAPAGPWTEGLALSWLIYGQNTSLRYEMVTGRPQGGGGGEGTPLR